MVRKNNTGSHMNALKYLLKSPSMSRLHPPYHNHKGHGVGTSADISSAATSGSSLNPEILAPPAQIRLPSRKDDINFPETAKVLKGQELSPSTSPAAAEASAAPPPPASKHSWKLKGMVAVIRHADRTPKQKFKFTFHTQPFIDLLEGHQEEVVIKGESALRSVSDAVNIAIVEGIEDVERLELLRASLDHKGGWPGTKVQIKPMFRRRNLGELRDSTLPMNSPAANTHAAADDLS